jgi:hypothetical protein
MGASLEDASGTRVAADRLPTFSKPDKSSALYGTVPTATAPTPPVFSTRLTLSSSYRLQLCTIGGRVWSNQSVTPLSEPAEAHGIRSVQAWHFEEAVAVRGGDAQLERATSAVDCEGYLNTRLAQSPDTAEEACQRPN